MPSPKPSHVPSVPQTDNFTLLHRFMLASAAILLVGALFIGWWIDRRIYAIVTEDSGKLAAVFVDSTVAPHLAELPSVNAIATAQAAHLQHLLRNNVESGRYVAVNLWAPTGELAYSTTGSTEQAIRGGEGFQYALAGNIYMRQTETVDGATGGPEDPPYLETYYPVRRPGTSEVIAVISFYQNLAEIEASTLQTRLQTWLVVGTATTLMYFLLFGLVRQGSETIQAQQVALDRSRRQIQQAAVRAAALNEAAMRRLGADLHDGPAQDLGIAMMRMEPLRQAVQDHVDAGGQEPLDVKAMAFDLQLIHTALQSSLQEVRNLASGLRLPELSDLELAGAVHKAVDDYMRKTGRGVDVQGPERLACSPGLKSAAYRIVQETLNNGHQHGAPAHQGVRYTVADGLFRLEVEDDGRGFDPDHIQSHGKRRQLGLAGLQERAEILGGTLEIVSAPGRGTLVRALLPLGRPDDEKEEQI